MDIVVFTYTGLQKKMTILNAKKLVNCYKM